jgi:hypothetical protein
MPEDVVEPAGRDCADEVNAEERKDEVEWWVTKGRARHQAGDEIPTGQRKRQINK